MPQYTNYKRRPTYAPYMKGSRIGKLSVPRSLPFKHDVQAIATTVASRVVKRNTEQKYQRISFADITLASTSFHWYAPMQYVVTGTNIDNRIGDKVSDLLLEIGFHYNHIGIDFAGQTNWEGSYLRVLVIKTAVETPHGTGFGTWQPNAAGVPFTQLLAENFQISSSVVNKGSYTVLYDSACKSHRALNLTPFPFGVPGKLHMKVSLGKTYHYKDIAGAGGVNYSKFNNIYVVIGASNPNSAATGSMGIVQSSGYLYFRDA